MNVFRIFFVSTVLIPVLVVVATSDESGIRIRKPRSIVIAEDGTRTGRRHNPVNITDRNCPSLGCTGNLTANEYNGKGSVAGFTQAQGSEGTPKGKRLERELGDDDGQRPFKLEVKAIKNSTKAEQDSSYLIGSDDVGTGRGLITYAVLVSWAFFYTWRVIVTLIIIYTFNSYWSHWKKTYGIGDDYLEYYVKLGKDGKHPFSNYDNGWLPSFGISLKSKIEDVNAGWKGWTPSKGWKPTKAHHHFHQPQAHYPSSYHDPYYHQGWPSSYHAGHDYGWPSGWPEYDPHPKKKGSKFEDEFESQEGDEDENMRHKFDRQKGWKIARKAAKKYGKKAYKYGVRPSKHSYMFDERGNIILGGQDFGYAWRRRK